jgi:(2Fe-2S) ferredoxin
MPETHPANDAAFIKMGLSAAQRHIFLCVGPDCCASADGLATWEVLKCRLSALKVPAMRTKAACLRICQGGPWLVIYPDGVWYGSVTPERCERIVNEHLMGGRPVEEWVAQKHPLLA